MNKYDDLEKTKDLFDIKEEIPTAIESLEMEGATKENFNEQQKAEEQIGETPVKEKQESKKPTKKSFKEKWLDLNKKKAMIIVSVVFLLLLAIGIVLFFILKKEKPEEKPIEPPKPSQIIEKDNYVYKDGTLIFLDQNDQEIGSYECNNKNEKLCYIPYFNSEDNFDEAKNYYEDGTLIERNIPIYLDEYVFIYDNSKADGGTIAIYNLVDKKLEEEKYTLVKGYKDNNLVILKNTSSKYGVLEFTEDKIEKRIKFTFDYLGMMNNSNELAAKTSNKYYIYNKDGSLKSKGIPYEIKSYNGSYLTISDDGKYAVYDYKGNLITDQEYDFIKLENDYMALIKDNMLYIRDYQNHKYHEEGIKLSNKVYNPKNYYNQNKVFVRVEKAFETSKKDDGIDIVYYEKDKEKGKTIDINDAVLSANYSYLNYFDDKLYFYLDEEKTKLLGSYTCNNKNNDKENLTNCVVATESFFSKNALEKDQSDNLGWLPILNERYVFIEDTIDLNNPTIILYDLVDKKTISKYKAVDAGLYTKDATNPFKEVDELYVMAISKVSDKYGIIKITKDGVNGFIPFNFDKIEKFRDYYLITNNNKYALYDNKGMKVTGEYDYKVVDYLGNYVKVVDNDKYYIYDFNGNKVDETSYKYIELGDTYYAAIDTSDTFNLYKYDDAEFKLSTEITIISENYIEAYTLKKSGEGFTLKINSTNTTYQIDSKGNIVEE